jgi:flavodoxin
MTMPNKIMVAYASRAGSTAGVAEIIGQTFMQKRVNIIRR